MKNTIRYRKLIISFILITFILSAIPIQSKLTLLDTQDDGGDYLDVYSDGTYVYTACGDAGIKAYTFDGTSFTLIASKDDGDDYVSIDGDGTYIYVACRTQGLRAYSFNGISFTLLDTQDDGGDYLGVSSYITGPTRIYASCDSDGIRYYTFNGVSFSYLDNQDDGTDYINSMRYDGYIHVACGYQGIRAYDTSLNLQSHRDQLSGDCYDVYTEDGEYIYLAYGSSGLVVYSFDGHYSTSYISKIDNGGTYTSIYSDGTYLYTACGTSGIRAYTFDNSTNTLTLLNTKDDGDDYENLYSEGGYIYVACRDSGVKAFLFYEIVANQSNPENEQSDIDLLPTTCINVSHPLGENVTINWYWKNGSIWTSYGVNTSVPNGTYCQPYLNATECCTTYYWRVTVNDSNNSWTNNTYYFTTLCPEPPENLSGEDFNSSAINITWTNWSIPANCTGNMSTYVRYSTDDYPSSRDEGTLLYNGTNESVTLDVETKQIYYVSAWTYYEKDSYFCWSDTYSTTSYILGGGDYNIYVYWECNQTLMLNTSAGFENSIIRIETREGELIYYQDGLAGFSNPFTVSLNQSPNIFFFNYNGSGAYRAITPSSGQRNISFYVCCYDIYNGTQELGVDEVQVWYTFSVDDYTVNTYFTSNQYTKLYFYKYNGTERYYIHQDYLSVGDTVRVCLHYNDRYFIGIHTPEYSIPFLQYFDTGEDTNPSIVIKYITENITYNIGDFLNISYTYVPTGLQITYQDFSFGTEEVTLNIYKIYNNNDTQQLKDTTTFFTSTKNYTYRYINGYDNQSYYTTSFTITHSLFNTTQYFYISMIFPLIEPLINQSEQEDKISTVFGSFPVPYIQLGIFAIVFTALIIFGNIYAEVGLIFSGGLLTFIEIYLLQYTSTFVFQSVSAGILMICLGILFAFGRSQK